MDALTHLNESRNLTALAAELFNRGQYLAAGEFVWGAIVHAVAAADPDHEMQPPDRFGNPHLAPNTSATFSSAIRRITGLTFSEGQIASCLYNGQQQLHNHFYHLNLTPQDLQHSIGVATAYAQLLMRAADHALSR
ncbi:MAG: hypothetical protein J4G13_08545 [Dehalococcoidia bacterium]|nr:hypothetical protein [Dehalococcoidia bacterium]